MNVLISPQCLWANLLVINYFRLLLYETGNDGLVQSHT